MKPLKLAVIGDPIGHTLSPDIHNAISGVTGIPCRYDVFHVPPAELPAFVRMASSELDGFNITIPHKQNILPYLSGTDPFAERCGAVNTVRIKDGKLYGWNTDGDGLYASLKAADITVEGKQVLLLGAGGAALSICRSALDHGAEKVTVLCRSPQKADLFRIPGTEIGTFSPQVLKKKAASAQLIIQATPLGMQGTAEDYADFSFLDNTSADICDIVYRPAETAFLRESRKRGLRAVNGLGMLIWQAVYAFAIFSGESFDLAGTAARVSDIMAEKLGYPGV